MGTSLANYFALAACAEPGDEVLIEQPTYALLLDTSRYLGLDIKRFQRPASLNYQVDLDDLRRQISPRTRLIVLCNLHNPSGALAPEVVPRSAFHIDPRVFLSTNSLTKAYGLSGIRCGWVLASPEIIERIWQLQDLHIGTNLHPGELLGVIAFQKLSQIAAIQKERLDENRRSIREILESQSALDYFWPDNGTVVFPRVKRASAAEFCERLRTAYEISVVPGNFFEDAHRIRIGVGGTTESVQPSLEQLRRALNDIH